MLAKVYAFEVKGVVGGQGKGEGGGGGGRDERGREEGREGMEGER